MRELTTGGAGFIGSNLADLLVGRGDQITVLDDLFSRVHRVFHPAAAFAVQLITARPLESLATIRGSDIVFENGREQGRRILDTSASEIFCKSSSDRLVQDDERLLGSPCSSSRLGFAPYEEGFEEMQRRVPDSRGAHGLVGFESTVPLDEIVHQVTAEQHS